MVRINTEEVFSRKREVELLLRPLAQGVNRFTCDKINAGNKTVLYAVRGPTKTTDAHRDWRFRSFVDTIVFRYTESWVSVGEGNFDLSHFSLGLHKSSDRTDDKEWLSFDCEPTHSESDPHGIYKQGPHLHIKVANDPLPHVHFPLITATYLPQVLDSSDTLFCAVSDIVATLKEQVLSVISNSLHGV